MARTMGPGELGDSDFTRRTYSLTNGASIAVDLQVDGTDTGSIFALEAADAALWGVAAERGKLRVLYTSGGAEVHPKDMVNLLKTNTWSHLMLMYFDSANT